MTKFSVVITLFVCTFVGSLFASKLPFPIKNPWLVCRNITSDSDAADCARIVDAGRHFDPYATAACDKLDGNSATVKCMGMIEGHWYQPAAVAVCNAIYSDKYTIECLAVTHCRSYSFSQLDVCDGINSDKETVNCLK